MARVFKRGDMKILQIFITVGLSAFIYGCSNTVADKPKSPFKESDVTPACQSDQLAPVMACGEYVIVKGRINSSHNLERVNETTMYISSLANTGNNTLINKMVLLSGKCSSESITDSSTMLYLNDARLLQILSGHEIGEIDKDKAKQICKNLKSS